MLKLYNTLTRRKEAFQPLDEKNVRLYVCGPTVYDFAHIGNARPIIVFDVLFRLLRHLYGEQHVTYVRNVTDVDDKINARAAERGISIRELTDGTLAQFNEDVAALNCLTPTHQPRATDYIEQMKQMIERLVMSDHAYIAEDHVLFAVASMPDYGKLSKRSLDEMQAGARVDVAAYKREPLDFVLWKPSRAASSSEAIGKNKSEPGWPSPCQIKTPGRPGWHIECSAMSAALLGEEFDIHGGGLDLIFPHHENEIAQTCCAFGTKRMAQIWMHNGFLQMEGEKMSKSAGNFATIREVLNDWPADVVRLTMLKTHYRQPIDWSVKSLQESQKTMDAWQANAAASTQPSSEFLDALSDDMNTPLAISVLHRLEGGALKASAQLVGLMHQSQVEWKRMRQANTNVDENAIRQLINERLAARSAKNFAESDRIRDALAEMGIRIKDDKNGTTSWEVM